MKTKRVARAIRALVNERGPSLECTRMLHKSLLVPTLMYGNRARGLRQ